MKYEGNTPLKTGDKVYLTAYEQEVKVVDALATQFTVKCNRSLRFFFYEDRGDTWQMTKETR